MSEAWASHWALACQGAFETFFPLTPGQFGRTLDNVSVDAASTANAFPLPSTVLLLGTGILGLTGLGWRRRKS